ncbi:MAG TPA: virginiamycin B lyase, partial [Thermoanaerobaculia bacterium]|nr:virginiamycin B lyase [Thermoanaerobaculia bacterium]
MAHRFLFVTVLLVFAARGLNAAGVSRFPLAPRSFPLGIAAGPDGNLWVTAQGSDEILKVTPAGAMTRVTGLPTCGGLWGIAAGPD